MPKVSVIIPVYNTENYLRKCLDSVCNQTLKDIEIICINDCSPDGCLDILREYASKDERIKIIDFKENKGAACARNAGIDTAQGEYLGFVDSDDFIDLDFYEKLYAKANETGADAIKGELWVISDKSADPQLPAAYDLNNLIKKNKAYFYYTFTSAIFNREFILKHNIFFPEGLCHLEDPYFTIKAACFYKKIKIVDNTNYYYVVTSGTRLKKTDEKETLMSLHKGILNIIDLINSINISKEHYIIVTSFLLNQIMDRINNFNSSDNLYNKLLDSMYEIFSKNKYKEEILPNYYEIKRKIVLNNLKLNKFRTIRCN